MTPEEEKRRSEVHDCELGNCSEWIAQVDSLRKTIAVLEQQANVALITAHRACIGSEHDPANGKIHGCCVVCGVYWPCSYTGTEPIDTLRAKVAELEQQSALHSSEKAIQAKREIDALRRERDEAKAALKLIYEKWENGTPCFEDPDECEGPLGNAFKLSYEEENKILLSLNQALEGAKE